MAVKFVTQPGELDGLRLEEKSRYCQALVAVVGPLIEVPVLIALVYASLWARKFFFASDGSALARVRLTTSTRPAGSDGGA